MNSKKKLIIAACSLGVVALSAVIALVAVIAAFNATGTSGFTISYTAKNVNATITAKYGLATATTVPGAYTDCTSGDSTTMVFNADDTTETVTKNFEEVTDIVLTKDNTSCYIVYTITNTATDGTSFTITSSATTVSEETDNLKVEYAVLASADELTAEKVAAADTWTTTISTADGTLAASEAKVVVVRYLMVNRTKNVNFSSDISFVLNVVD